MNDDHRHMNLRSKPVHLRGWVDCPTCGRIEKLSMDFHLPADAAALMRERVGFACERCGTHNAFLVLERTTINLH